MRLSDVLSKPLSDRYDQVEGFLNNRKVGFSNQRKIQIGKVALNYFCKCCNDDRTFCSSEVLYCVGISNQIISIDCALKCPRCNSTVQTWFLVECEEEICSDNPKVRILKRSEKLSDMVLLSREIYGDFSELLEKAQRAYRDGLGAGAIVYLRKVFEQVTEQTADVAGISKYTKKENRKTFRSLLDEVEAKQAIIPKEFSANGYRLFGELSDVVHGNYDELKGLEKYESLYRLVKGVVENVKNNKELIAAIGILGWSEGGGATND